MLIQSFSDQPIAASVTRTAWALNVRSRTLRAEIDLPNTGGSMPDDLPNVVKDGISRVKLPSTSAQILPGMYAYGQVTIKRPDVWTIPNAALDYFENKACYWTVVDGRAVRMEVHTGVTDGQWTEVTSCRPLAAGAATWTPINGSEQVVLADDVSTLTDGMSLKVAPEHETSKADGAAATSAQLPRR